ncbi:hypothetical protein SLS56_006792 [Neofusicoccum ribis]|uniref:DUF676 domain-containing protein n=1 Tax=Neofusicoccum ribis TaxID=45134 RepID=A0ABR3SPU7_9PEZI
MEPFYIPVTDSDDDTDLELDDDFERFTPLHSAADDACDVDIIAITGLNGHAFGSFKGKDRGKMWLRDFLPKDYNRARIFTYGYRTREPSSQSITDLAITFNQLLKSLRRNSKPRPWIVISHSMGGILAKTAIKRMAESENRDLVDTYKSLRAVLFFGVPSDGMNIEALKPMFSDAAVRHLIETIDELRPIFLREIHDGFLKAVRKLTNFTSFNFYEAGLVRTLTKVKPKIGPFSLPTIRGDGELAKPVSELSATQGSLSDDYAKHRVFPVNRSHRDLVKFSSRNDEVYKTVVNCLEELEMDIPRQPEKPCALASNDSGLTEAESGKYGTDWKWTEKQLRDCLLEMLENVYVENKQELFLFIDAVDELGSGPDLELCPSIVNFLENKLRKLHIHICYSARYSKDPVKGAYEIEMGDENYKDIKSVVEANPTLSRLRRNGDELENLILERQQGSFLWVSTILKLVFQLSSQGKTYKTIIANVRTASHPLEDKPNGESDEDKEASPAV